MSNAQASAAAHLEWVQAQTPVERRLRGVRAYVVPLRGAAGFRTIPVARFSAGDEVGVDVPMLTDVWTIDGITDEETIPILTLPDASRRGQRRWELYNIWFIRPRGRAMPVNQTLRYMGATQPVTGEFIVFRKGPNTSHILDMRREDHVRMEVALRRLVRLLYSRDFLWHGTL
ncbi:hypothetical protein NUW54_g946 [Trametes sanguinea]|uniref:Uncharacterized protein n=1 Tax=Trametes sanguinea TaxID=158606 RepID=A0ACC1QAP9_9APHY|nr:hypothetical protein NUW54_g946 [Trametes sanguinea]